MNLERLTIKDEDGYVALNCGVCSNDGSTNCDIENCYLTAIYRLATIEDILGDTYDLGRIRELVEADREGRCVVLPCKLGSQVFEHKPQVFMTSDCFGTKMAVSASALNWEMVPKFGDSVFFTREEAEKALEEHHG